MNKKWIAAIAVVVAVIIGIIFGVRAKAAKNTEAVSSEPQAEATVSVDEAAEPAASASPAAVSPSPAAESTTGSSGSTWYWGDSYTYTPVQKTNEPEAPKVVSFPYEDANTGIVVGTVGSYDGIYLEDSSDDEVYGIAVVMVQNVSGSDLELVQITLTQGDESYHFEVSALPGGAVAAVQEKDRKALPDGDFNTCAVAATEGGAFDMSTDSVTVVENEDGTLDVTNVAGYTIPCVRIFYKFYSEEDGAFVGGITYTAKLTDLEDGVTLNINPSHYVAGYSKVVMVRTYDTAED